jgi:hypothetical protein
VSAATMIDWNAFLEVGVPLWIAAICSGIAAIVTSMNRRSLKTPSGDSIGEQVESAHHLTAANTALLTQIHQETGATITEPEEENRV